MPPKERERFIPPPPAQALAELKNLVHRSKPDFRGNLGPAVKVKTQADYDAERKARISKLPDGEEFRHSYKIKQPLGFVATKGSKVRPASADACRRNEARERRDQQVEGEQQRHKETHPNYNRYHQTLDTETGRPVLETVLHWNEERENERPSSGKLLHDGKKTGKRVFDEKYQSDLQRVNAPGNDMGLQPGQRATRQDVEDLTPRHRTALIRALTLQHPKYTKESMVARPTQQWEPMSQLLSHQYAEDARRAAEIKKEKKAAAAARQQPESARVRNSVRMVALMRQAQGKSQKAWH